MEIWKDIEGFEGLYQVSNYGNVKNRKGHIMRPATDKDKRQHLVLSKNGKQWTKKVHRLVALAFIPNPCNYKEVNHKDENPSNNNVKNLEWCNRTYNQHYGTAIQRMAESMKGKFVGAKSVLSKCIFQYSVDGNFMREWESIHAIKRELNINVANISSCCSGKRQSAGGYVWKYKKEAVN